MTTSMSLTTAAEIAALVDDITTAATANVAKLTPASAFVLSREGVQIANPANGTNYRAPELAGHLDCDRVCVVDVLRRVVVLGVVINGQGWELICDDEACMVDEPWFNGHASLLARAPIYGEAMLVPVGTFR